MSTEGFRALAGAKAVLGGTEAAFPGRGFRSGARLEAPPGFSQTTEAFAGAPRSWTLFRPIVRLTTQIAAVCTALMAALMMIQALVHVQRVADLSRSGARHALVEQGAGLVDLLGSFDPRRGGWQSAIEFLERYDERRPELEVDFFDEAPPPVDGEAHLDYQSFSSDSGLEARVAESEGWIVAEFPVDDPRGAAWTLRLRHPTAKVEQFVDEAGRRNVLTTLALILVAGLAAWLFGNRIIGRPIGELVRQTTRIGQGDFEVSKKKHRRDELGRLQSAVDAMSERLARARRVVARRRKESTAIMSQLRHADRLSSVGKLASGLAHELGTPLNVVMGRAQMIEKAPESSELTQKNARIIYERSEHMAGLIRQLMDFTRRRGTQIFAEPREILETAVSLVEPSVEDEGVQIELDAPTGAATLMDRQRVLQVLTNLMINAEQAMPDGGTMKVGARVANFDDPPEGSCPPGRYIEFFVEDEGTGIDPETLPQIFEPFFTTKSEGSGTGLGLSISHGIVREHGGWMSVDSKVGVGSRFAFTIPLRKENE